MTVERAIQILDPEHREHYESIEPVNEACRMGMEALKRMQWISVKDRLPWPGENILLYTPDCGIFIDLYDGFEFGVKGATHWMPLPEPPKEV